MTWGNNSTKFEEANKDKMTLAEKLRAEREKKGVTTVEVAKAIGTSQSFISHIESGRKTPSTAVIVDIAKYYAVSLDYLLGEE